MFNGNRNGFVTSSSTILLRSHTEGMKTGCIVTLTNMHYYCGYVRDLAYTANDDKRDPRFAIPSLYSV